MSTASNLIVLLDLVEAGLTLNTRLSSYFRDKELAGEKVDIDDLEALASESDNEFQKFKQVFK